MGNSKSQLKRSRSEYGSTRSVAFSLPSTWDTRSYAYGETLNRHASISQSTASLPLKPILRNNSSVSASTNFSSRRSVLTSNGLAHSLHSLREPAEYDRGKRLRRQSLTESVSQQANKLSHKQYSDIYLKNDLRKVFRSQDRSSSVAAISDEPDQSNAADLLDRKLFMLKAQRKHASGVQPVNSNDDDENKREGATERRVKSRKLKKAPLPDPSLLNRDPQASSKSGGLFRKKVAPRSSSKDMAPAVGTSPDLHQSLLKEIEIELAKHNIPISPTEEKQIEIPKPDYDSLLRITSHKALRPISKQRKVKPKAPPTPAQVAVNDIPATPFTKNNLESKIQSPQVVVADVEIHNEPVKPTDRLPSLESAAPAAKKEVCEIAIQYDAPVEIAIQCSGNTLREKSTRRNSNASLSELLQMFNEAIQAGKVKPDQVPGTPASNGDDQSVYSDESSSHFRNEARQKIVPMQEVLAGVPEAPPLPDLNVKLIQRRTIRDHAAVSMAPAPPELSSPDAKIRDTPRSFSTFQQQLVKAYEKIEEKRKVNPTLTNAKSIPRRDSITSEANALSVFRNASTIMGVQTPQEKQETESDSGNDEPSDCSNSLSQGDRTPSIPDFVFDGIARSFHSDADWNYPDTDTDLHLGKNGKKNNKTKFNSIKRLKKSVRQLVSTKRADSIDSDFTSPDLIDQSLSSNENWTLSGRTKPSRMSLIESGAFTIDSNGATNEELHHKASMSKSRYVYE